MSFSARLKSSIEWVTIAATILGLEVGITTIYHLSQTLLAIMLSSTGLALLLVVLIYTLSSNIERMLDNLESTMVNEFEKTRQTIASLVQSGHDPPEEGEEKEKEEEIKTTGVGALAGMIVGGMIGLALGPLGVVLGGLLGAIIGDQMEYQKLLEEKQKGKKFARKKA